jgi:ferric-dicitrate binding protein FerR (iron transport regulator)
MTDNRTDIRRFVEDDDLEPIDPDIEIISHYLAGGLSPDDEASVKDRLVKDGAFFEKVWPLIQAWNLPVRFSERFPEDALTSVAVSDEQLEPMWHDVREKLGFAPRSFEGFKEDRALLRKMDADHAPAYVSLDELEPRRRSSWPRRVLLAASIVITLVASSAGLVVQLRSMAQRHAETAEGRPSTIGFVSPRTTETGVGEWREVELGNGTRVFVQPRSRFTVADQWSRMEGGTAAMNGEIAIVVPENAGWFQLHTPQGYVRLLAGRYAVRGELGQPDMLVTVDSGTATVRGLDAPGRTTRLGRGERASVTRGGRVLRGSRPEGYPRADIWADVRF